MKISEDPIKSTIPGTKNVYRLLDDDGRQLLLLIIVKFKFIPSYFSFGSFYLHMLHNKVCDGTILQMIIYIVSNRYKCSTTTSQ